MYQFGSIARLGLVVTIASMPALAVEGAVGRTLPGVWIQPQGAVVGPESGFSFTTFPIGYMGAIGGGRLVPEGGSLFANVDANINTNWFVPEYVYKTETPRVSFASGFLGVVTWVGSTGSLQFDGATRSTSQSNAGAGDMAFYPLTAGIHLGENNNLAISTMIFAPVGHYSPGSISNLGMNEWTFMPNFGHTYLWKKRGLEFDNFVGFDIYTENPITHYTSGTMFHWDGMVMQYLSERAGFGVIASNLTQLTDDTGPSANRLHGFEGRAWGVGPIVMYVAKTEKPGVILQLRWVNEFKVTNLMKGNTFMFGLTLKMH